MSVLTLQLAGPLQAWGSAGRFARRTTERAPTKSGVIGLLAAAQGRDRQADLGDLAALRFGVRVDQRGSRVRDYQTAVHPDTGQRMPVSERFYLADAVFVAALESEDAALIRELHRAVREPVYLPYLGRRSCPPARPVDLGVHDDTDLAGALAGEEWRASRWHQQRRRREEFVELDLLIDATPGDGEPVDTQRDQPLSFDPLHRRYALRGVRSYPVTLRNPAAVPAPAPPDHDPTAVLEGD